MAVVGVVLVLTAASGPDEAADETFDATAVLLLAVAGALYLGFGLSLVTARATFSADAVEYRYGVVRRSIPAYDVDEIVVGPGSGAYYGRICPHIRVRGRKRPVRLIGIQRAATEAGDRLMGAACELATRIVVGQCPVERPDGERDG
jgi:hypothetical protein